MTEQDLLLIEQYYRGELGEAERLAFEQRMSEDHDFQEGALLHQRAMTAIRLHGKEALKKNLGERPLVMPDRPSYIWRRIGTVILIMAAFTLYWAIRVYRTSIVPSAPAPILLKDTVLQKNDSFPLPPVQPTLTPPSDQPTRHQKSDPQKLFVDAFKPYQDGSASSTIRSGSQNSDTSSSSGLNQLKQLAAAGKYTESLAAFEQLPPEIQGKAAALFFKANSLLALGRADEAAVLFEEIASNLQTNYSGHARWYAALCALKKGDLPKAKKWLQAVIADGNMSKGRRTEAKLLLRKIRSLPK